MTPIQVEANLARCAQRCRWSTGVVEALIEFDGEARRINLPEVAWRRRQVELRTSGDIFCRWSDDIQWAATELRKVGYLADNARGEPRCLIQ